MHGGGGRVVVFVLSFVSLVKGSPPPPPPPPALKTRILLGRGADDRRRAMATGHENAALVECEREVGCEKGRTTFETKRSVLN